jgi:hypothetical protein
VSVVGSEEDQQTLLTRNRVGYCPGLDWNEEAIEEEEKETNAVRKEKMRTKLISLCLLHIVTTATTGLDRFGKELGSR